MSERAFAWRGLALAGRAAAVLGGLLAAAIGSPAEAQILGTACASPSATVAASATILGNATPRLNSICTGGIWQLLPHQVSNTTLPCESATTGLLRYSGGLQVCTGSAWTTLGGAETLALDDLSDALTTGTSIYIGNGVGNTAANNDNTGIGLSSMQSMMSGAVENAAYGKASLATLTTGDANAAFGASALAIVNTGSYNTGVGQNAGQRINGTYNTLFGTGAGRGATNAVVTGTTAVGVNAGVALTSSTGNILIGYQAGDGITTGNYNIVIGYDADPFSNTGSNQLNIGNTIYGDLGIKRIGIGTTAPSANLHVSGSILVQGSVGNFSVDNTGAWASFSRNSGNYINLEGAAGELHIVRQWNAADVIASFRPTSTMISTSLEVRGTLHVSGTVQLRRNGSAPTTCNSTVNGLLALTSAAKMCVCDGTSWKDVGSNYGACSW